MTNARETLDLEAFLSRMPEADAAELRAAAAEIEELERRIGPPGWIERNLVRLGIAAALMFLIGIGALIGVLTGLKAQIGLGGVVLLISAFPALVFAYLWTVRGQTALDARKMDLNDRHFVPRGGIYFGTRAGGKGKVLLVERPKQGEPDLRQRTEALYGKATRRRWWW